MSITIRSPKVEKLALRVSRLSRETTGEAIRKSLEERLQRLKVTDAVRKSQ